MSVPQYQAIYDITKTYEENLETGPNPKYKATLKAPKLKHEYTVLGHKVGSPFGSAACPTGTDSRFIKLMFDSGFDIVTSKTRRSVHFAPNEVPNIVHIVPGKLHKDHDFERLPDRLATDRSDYETLTVANSFGNNSIDPEYWVPDAKLANDYVKDGQLLITSIVGTIQPGFSENDYYRDFAATAKLAKDAGAQAIEINLSCPNVANEGVLCYDPDAVLEISKLVKAAVGDTPVLAKIGYFPKESQGLLEDIIGSVSGYVNGITAINTLAAPIFDDQGRQAMPGKGRLKAGLSGHAIKDLGVHMTERLVDFRKRSKLKFEIISIGGVLTPADFNEYLQAGSDAVLSATGAIWNANLAAEIKQSLAK
jgi:dihydroorotate dehydrogenase (NAD+) catalytic subunit